MDRMLLRKCLIGEFSVRRLVRSSLIIYACLGIFAFVWSDHALFQPGPASYRDGEGILHIPRPDGTTISASYLEVPGAPFTVLYNHANAVDLGDIRFMMADYRSKGFSVLTYDYRGYGTTAGRATSRNACRDADTALAYLVEQCGVPLARVIVHGRSVGGGPAVYLAHKHAVAGLIVESSFTTAFRVLTRVPVLPFDKFRNISRIGDVDCPVLVIHGRNDRTIPFWHGEKLFEEARAPKISCWLDESTHNYIPMAAETEYWQAISGFARSLVPAATPNTP